MTPPAVVYPSQTPQSTPVPSVVTQNAPTIVAQSTDKAAASSNAGATYYVATNGSDETNDGTLQKPFRSLQRAINQIGDGEGGTILVRGGVYRSKEAVWMGEDHDGNEKTRLVLQPYQNEKVILEGPSDNSVVGVGGQYVDIVGLEIRKGKAGITGWGAKHLRILNNVVHNTDDSGIASYAPKIFEAAHITVKGNKVYRTNLKNQSRREQGEWGSGITMSRTKHAIVTDNLVYENYGEGITATLSDRVLIARNTIHDNYSVELYADNATNTIFENNLIYNSGDGRFDRKYGPASGIQMGNEQYEVENVLNHNIIRNNIVIGTGEGFAFGAYPGRPGIKNTQVINNTFYGLKRSAVSVTGQHENIQFANNIVYQTAGKPLTDLSKMAGVTFKHNLWFGGTPGQQAKSATDVQADPQFVNPGGLKATDYRLRSGSRARSAGERFQGLVQDFTGQPRPKNQQPDLGAHEFGGE